MQAILKSVMHTVPMSIGHVSKIPLEREKRTVLLHYIKLPKWLIASLEHPLLSVCTITQKMKIGANVNGRFHGVFICILGVYRTILGIDLCKLVLFSGSHI